MGTRTYLISQGYQNMRKHGGKTFSTMLIICATMLILGLFLITYINIETNIKVITENQGLQAFISDEVSEREIEELATKIKNVSNVKEIKYLDKDSALEDAKSILKDYAYLLEGTEKSNPFPRSFQVVFDKVEDSKAVKTAIESIDGIYKVGYNETVIDAVISISKVGNIVLIGIGAIMVIISIFIISNTIKLAVYSNKREIYIMKFIGATNKFIKLPFIIEGILMGLLSALFSFVTISLIYLALYSRLPKLGTEIGMFGFVPYSEFWYYVLAAFVVFGAILGSLGSSVATKKYLKDFKPTKVGIDDEKKKDKYQKDKRGQQKNDEKENENLNIGKSEENKDIKDSSKNTSYGVRKRNRGK